MSDETGYPLHLSAAHLFLIPLLVLTPIFLWKLDLPFIASSYGPDYVVLELFALCVFLILMIFAWDRLRNPGERTLEHALPVLTFVALSLYFVVQVTEYSAKSADWSCYVDAARALIEGKSPYFNGCYIYPPILAVVLSWFYYVIEWGAIALNVVPQPDLIWNGVFYLYQCAQFFSVVWALVLSFRFLSLLRVEVKTAAIMIAVVFVFNVPLLRTFRHQQINLWVLDLVLYAILALQRRPWLSGLATAIAAHLKLYPLVFLPWLVAMRKFRALAWTTVAICLIAVLQVFIGGEFWLWEELVLFVPTFPSGTAFRDNSLHSLIFNTAHGINWFIGLSRELVGAMITVLVWGARAGVLLWFALRFVRREKSYRVATAQAFSIDELETHRVIGNLLDSLASVLLISPMVWEHHYVLAMPLIFQVIAIHGRKDPWRVGTAVFLICCVPVFDLFPLSYHRLAGLIWLLWLSPPTIRSSHS